MKKVSLGLSVWLLCSLLNVQPAVAAKAVNAWVEIDRDAFDKNIRTLQKLIGPDGAKICAVMKTDAYGHGISLLAPSIVKLGVPCVGITDNEEARKLRKAGFTHRILRLRTATLEEIEAGLKIDIEESFGNLELAKAASALAQRKSRTIRVHVALNSGGMSRNGLDLKTDKGKREALLLTRLPGLRIVGVMTHFAVEERDYVTKAFSVFQHESSWLIENAGLDRSKLILHAACSFGTLEVPESRLDMVRPGALLYGDMPLHPEYLRVMQFKSRVAAVNEYPAGNTVSYDRTFELKRDSRLANVPVGYGNGYRRTFSNKAFVLIRGHRYPIVGRVTMNTIMIDVTDAPEISAGDEVVLFGKQGSEEITQSELEKIGDTILADLYTIWGANNPRFLKTQP